MAKRRSYRNNPYNAKAYKFTARRRAALKKAQARSARERKIKVGIMAVGGLAAVGVGLYLGRNTAAGKDIRRSVARNTRHLSMSHVGRAANLKRARAAVNPITKEGVRMASAISPASTPAQPGHVGSQPLHIGPHTPADGLRQAKPDPATFKRTNLGRESEESIKAKRDALAAEEAWKKSDQGSIARFTDTSEATVAQVLVHGQPISRGNAARAVGQHEAAKARSGGQGATKGERRDTVDAMIAGSIDTARAVHGLPTPIRDNPRASGPQHIGAGASLTEHDAIWAEYDAHRGLSATRPGTVPHTTAAASHTTSVPGKGTSHNAGLAVGANVPGWHGLSKEKKAAMRGIAETGGLKINAVGKISRGKKPKANPSGKTPAQRAHQTRRENTNASRAQSGIYSMPTSNPSHGQEVPHWDLLTPEQQHRAQEGFRRYSAARGWRTMLGASGSYMDFDR